MTSHPKHCLYFETPLVPSCFGLRVILGFRCGLNEIFDLLGCYERFGRFGTTYRSHNAWQLKMGPIGCFETSVSNHLSLRNNPEDRRFQVLDCCKLAVKNVIWTCELFPAIWQMEPNVAFKAWHAHRLYRNLLYLARSHCRQNSLLASPCPCVCLSVRM